MHLIPSQGGTKYTPASFSHGSHGPCDETSGLLGQQASGFRSDETISLPGRQDGACGAPAPCVTDLGINVQHVIIVCTCH